MNHSAPRLTAPAASVSAFKAVSGQESMPTRSPDRAPVLERTEAADPATSPLDALTEFPAYIQDLGERTILFWDALRRRADNMIAHERAGKPPLLDFDFELLLDARRFPEPANYALLRITRAGGACLDDCLDPAKPPVIVVDPRAGHGPGIGGFKRDSEVGMALQEGHAVYFVVFYPEPVPGQELSQVLHALRRFVEEVARRHDGRAPVLYGNCQAGWAMALLAADCEGLAGPVVLNGSPLSYWAGESGVNPMRVSGGLLGGAWIANLLADLGGGRFDGAWLVQNFENLKPEAVWNKYANLLMNVDADRERFLEFERWWNGFYFLSREEILAIIDDLFIGNRLEEGRVRICQGCYVDLRRIRNPIVIFASYGDDITPPHQALGWIPAVYRDTADLKAAGQRIVYLTNPHVGHLGIFVSAKVARFEHHAILRSLGEISELRPGLYEMKIESPSGHPGDREPVHHVRFEEREVADIGFHYSKTPYEQVRAVSELNEALYRWTVGPWIRAAANPWSAAALEWLHPMRTSRYLFAEAFMPAMRFISVAAQAVEANRHALDPEHPWRARERQLADHIFDALAGARRVRDAALERAFDIVYGSPPSVHVAWAPTRQTAPTAPSRASDQSLGTDTLEPEPATDPRP